MIPCAELRATWLNIIRNHADGSTASLREVCPAIFNELYRRDRAWLMAHMPDRRTSSKARQVDWEQREQDARTQVSAAADAIRRVHLAAAQCRAADRVPMRVNFIKLAGLSRAVQTEKVMKVVDAVYGALLTDGIGVRICQISTSG